MLSEVFFHRGNPYQSSLSDSDGDPYSKGCQTGGCGPGSLETYNQFMENVPSNFNGSYYLRSIEGKGKGVPKNPSNLRTELPVVGSSLSKTIKRMYNQLLQQAR